MYQIDNPSAVSVLPNPTAVGTPGFFTDGNPSTGIDPTILPAEFLNMVMMEIANVVTGVGFTLSKTNFTQLKQAISRNQQKTTVLTDTGVANAYAAVNSPALVAADLASGMMQKVSMVNANTGASTYAPDGLTAKPILGMGLSPLQGGEIVAKGIAVLLYLIASNINAGNGAWILIECTGAPVQVAAATQSQHAVQLSQVNANGVTPVTTTGTLTAAVAGGTVIVNSASATTQTLPAASSIAAGKRIQFLNSNTGLATVARAGSDTITTGSTTSTSLALGNGSSLTLESNGSNGWYAVGGSAQLGKSAQFAGSIIANGWDILPNGRIQQWGTFTAGTENVDVTVTFPISFNNTPFSLVITDAATTSNNAVVWASNNLNASNFTAHYARSGLTIGSTTRNAFYIAIGN